MLFQGKTLHSRFIKRSWIHLKSCIKREIGNVKQTVLVVTQTCRIPHTSSKENRFRIDNSYIRTTCSQSFSRVWKGYCWVWWQTDKHTHLYDYFLMITWYTKESIRNLFELFLRKMSYSIVSRRLLGYRLWTKWHQW